MARSKKTLPVPPDEAPDLASVADFDDLDDEDFAAEVDALNDPDIEHLSDPPSIGGSDGPLRDEDLFGEEARYAMGRAMSPRLYSQAAQFPTCAQLRVWKWENGIPVGLGAIEATATEEDLVRRFYSAMPKRGEGRGQFKLRPIDIRGKELGQEVTLVVSEHHSTIQGLRAQEEEDASGASSFMGGSGSDAYSEMGRMFEHAMEASEQRSQALETALESERERLRTEDLQRAQERIDLATNAAQGVQALTERMMGDESRRSERSMQMQSEQSNMLLTTLTSIFAQQQQMGQQSSDQQRRGDEFRLEQERQRADRERQTSEERQRSEAQEWERKRTDERDSAVASRQQEREEQAAKLAIERDEGSRRFEQLKIELDSRLQREREDMERKERRERDEAERRDRWMAEERARRETREAEEGRQRDSERQRQHERMLKDVEMSAQRDREHAERMMALSKMELQSESQASGMNVLGNAAGLLKQFGVEPSEILPKLFAPEEERSGWLEAIPKVLGVAAEVARASFSAKARAAEAGPPPMLPAGAGPYPGEAEMYADFEPDQMFGAPRPLVASPDEVAAEMSSQEQEQEPGPPPNETPAQARTRELSALAAEAGVPLRAQKNARVELRSLVRTLADAPHPEWETAILSSLQKELGIYHYVHAVTVRSALQEAGADPEHTDRICTLMASSAVVPDDLPYG